jgi:hypothetical protein
MASQFREVSFLVLTGGSGVLAARERVERGENELNFADGEVFDR